MIRKIAILGCGYVGGAVGASLVDDGHDVVGTTTTPERQPEIAEVGIKPIVLQLSDTENLRSRLVDRNAVYLCVAAGRERRNYREVYLDGAGNLVLAMKDSAVGRIIYTSSTGVYGRDDGGWVDEETSPEPVSENGRILLATEHELLTAGERMGIAVSVVRLAGIIGPGRDPADRVASLAGTTRDDGDAYINLVHRDRIVDVLTRLLSIDHHGVLNLSNNQPETRRAYYDRLLAARNLTPINWENPDRLKLGKRIRADRIDKLLRDNGSC